MTTSTYHRSTTRNLLTSFGWNIVTPPANSPELAPFTKRDIFSGINEVKETLEKWLREVEREALHRHTKSGANKNASI
ncbi:hypothetical protein J437_LFUL014236 [Ladona fulva]|uniref:Uncharacterized protein n=1 Tax=Ladona fulva TaxID=123851 RepID=A0A8K0P6H3_LADFU|nr:hypothetical protein J437_LFUL014236 [Ladona fulva]